MAGHTLIPLMTEFQPINLYDNEYMRHESCSITNLNEQPNQDIC